MRSFKVRQAGCGGNWSKLILLAALASLPSRPSALESRLEAQAPSSAPAASAPVIKGVRARLFLNKKGEWSNDVLAPGAADLRNSGAGPDASNATLVIVEVSGQAGGNYTGSLGAATRYSVRLIASEGRQKTLLDQTQRIPVLDARGTVYLPFLLRQGGCTAVVLRVSIVGAVTGKPFERTLPFTCGE